MDFKFLLLIKVPITDPLRGTKADDLLEKFAVFEKQNSGRKRKENIL